MQLVNLVLRPFGEELQYLVKDERWSFVFKHMDTNFSEIGGMM